MEERKELEYQVDEVACASRARIGLEPLVRK